MGDAAENLTTLPVPVLEAFKTHEHFAKCMLDAYAVVDELGKVHKCNGLFSQLVGQKPRQILKAESFDHLLKLSVAGKALTIGEIARAVSPNRYDEVSGAAGDRDSLN